MKAMIDYLVQSMTDGLKDGWMFYKYAREAEKNEYPDLMAFFLQRAKTRIQMMAEDHARLMDLFQKMQKGGTEMPEGKWKCLYDNFLEQKAQLEYYVANFK